MIKKVFLLFLFFLSLFAAPLFSEEIETGWISGQMMIKDGGEMANGMVVFFRAEVPVSDYTVSSGIFNVKGDTPDDRWLAYVLETLTEMARLSRRGFAFNVLTSYSDRDRMRGNLYYADPGFMLDYCKKTFSRYVAVLHDYPLYEFTVLVRFEPV